MTPEALLELESRGEIKRWGAWLDEEGREQRPALIALARRMGREIPEDWGELQGKRLLKRLLDREAAAQIRRNPIHRDEAFLCGHCGRDVPIGGRRPRDHCPFCLYSRHVDDTVPGDRASRCGGLLVPVGVERVDGVLDLLFRCEVCAGIRRNRVIEDGIAPDDRAAIRALMAGA